MKDSHIEDVAHLVINHSCKLQPGESVLIEAVMASGLSLFFHCAILPRAANAPRSAPSNLLLYMSLRLAHRAEPDQDYFLWQGTSGGAVRCGIVLVAEPSRCHAGDRRRCFWLIAVILSRTRGRKLPHCDCR